MDTGHSLPSGFRKASAGQCSEAKFFLSKLCFCGHKNDLPTAFAAGEAVASVSFGKNL